MSVTAVRTPMKSVVHAAMIAATAAMAIVTGPPRSATRADSAPVSPPPPAIAAPMVASGPPRAASPAPTAATTPPPTDRTVVIAENAPAKVVMIGTRTESPVNAPHATATVAMVSLWSTRNVMRSMSPAARSITTGAAARAVSARDANTSPQSIPARLSRKPDRASKIGASAPPTSPVPLMRAATSKSANAPSIIGVIWSSTGPSWFRASVPKSVMAFRTGVNARPALICRVSSEPQNASTLPCRLFSRSAATSAAVTFSISAFKPAIPSAPCWNMAFAARMASLPNIASRATIRCVSESGPSFSRNTPAMSAIFLNAPVCSSTNRFTSRVAATCVVAIAICSLTAILESSLTLRSFLPVSS